MIDVLSIPNLEEKCSALRHRWHDWPLLDTTLKLDTFVTVDLFLHLFAVNDITVKPCETWCVRPTQLALSPSIFSLLNICFFSHTWLCICIRARTMQYIYIYDVYVYDLFVNYSGFKLLFILSMKSILANQFAIARKSYIVRFGQFWALLSRFTLWIHTGPPQFNDVIGLTAMVCALSALAGRWYS